MGLALPLPPQSRNNAQSPAKFVGLYANQKTHHKPRFLWDLRYCPPSPNCFMLAALKAIPTSPQKYTFGKKDLKPKHLQK